MCNFAAPSLVKSNVSACILKMVGHAVGVSPDTTCAILVSPAFSYTKGSLYSEEFALLKTLANSGCNVDMMFQVCFDPKSKTAFWGLISSIIFFGFFLRLFHP